MMVGQQLSYWVLVTFRGRTVKLREGSKGSRISESTVCRPSPAFTSQSIWRHFPQPAAVDAVRHTAAQAGGSRGRFPPQEHTTHKS